MDLVFFLVPAFVILFIGWLWGIYKQEVVDDMNNANNDKTITLRLQLSLDDLIALYNKTFDSNVNQFTLESKHIVTNTNITTKEEEREEKNHDGESFVDIEVGDHKSLGAVNNVKDVDNIGDNDPSLYLSVEFHCKSNLLVDDTTTIQMLCLDHNNNKEPQQQKQELISGTCILCFEEFVKDDVIIWSGDQSCHHIYHKECMVNYLANHAQCKRSKTLLVLDVTTNPCPTCRRNDFYSNV